jgi:hypothetical protein
MFTFLTFKIMTDKTKNIVSNILGLLMVIVAVYTFIIDKITVTQFSILGVAGLGLFLFKATETKTWLRKILSKKVSE